MTDASPQPQYDVFLSHNSRDKQAVIRLAEKLTEVGLRPWLDSQRLTPGGRWQDELAEGLAACRSCAVFLGPHGMGDWVWEELGLATDRAAKDRTFRLFPVLLPGVPDPFDPTALPPFLRARNWVDLRLGYEDPRLFNRLVNAIKGMAIDEETPITTGECPYRGLQVFDEDHAEFYFGREADVQRLLEKLKESRVLGIVGPSGSGKSSLARAGLIPAIRAGRLPGSHSWTTAVFTPGQHPLTALTAQICRLLPDRAPGGVLDLLNSDFRTLHLETEVILSGRLASDRLVLIIDQLEEIFTLCRDDAERSRFLDALLYAAEIPGGRTIVLFTLRADFYPRCAAFPNLATSLGTHHYLVGPMTEDGLRRAIEQPAHKVGLTFDDGLVDTILDDVIREPGALPLLEHALLELWERRRGQRLTLQGYKESGGVRGAIAARADAVYATLSPEQQGLVRQVMLRLTEPGEGTEDTRRRASLDELTSNTRHREALEAAVGALADARLLIVSGDEGEDETVVDVAHEALIRGWPRLRQWLDEDRAGLRVLRQLTESAEEWQRRGRDESLLYRGVRLLEATELRARLPDSLNEEERAFLDASVALRDREQFERERAQRARESMQRKIVIGLAAGLAVALLLSLIAWNQRSEAREGRREAAAGREVAVTRAAEADAARQTAQVDRSNAEAQSTVAADEKAGADVARQTAESRRVEAEGAQLTAESRRVDAETAQQTAQADRAEAEAQSTVAANERAGALNAQATAEARRVEAVNAEGTAEARRVEAENAQETAEARRVEAEHAQGTAEAERQAAEVARTDALVRYLAGEARSDTITNDAALLVSVEALAFRPDLPQARGALDSALQREHHLKKYLPQSVSDRNAIRVMAFSPVLAQPTLAIADRWTKSVTIWDVNAGRPLGEPLTDLPNEIWSLAYSPDGLMLAVGCRDGSVTLWNPITRSRRRLVLTSDETTVASLAFNSTGTQLVGAMESGAVFVWDVTTADTAGRVIGRHNAVAWDVSFIPGTDTFATAGEDGEIRFWDLASFAETGEPLVSTEGAQFWSVSIDPTGRTLVALDSFAQMTFWSINGRERLGQPVVLGQLLSMARVVNDASGPLVVATGRNGSVFAVDLATRQLRQVYDGHRALVEILAVSSDGRTVATADISNSVILWDTAQSARYAKPIADEDSAQLSVDVSPDGTVLASGGADGRLTIWDVKTKTAKEIINAHNGAVNGLAFSPSSETIATAGADGKVVLWEVASGDQIASFEGEDNVAVNAVAFRADGGLLVAGDQNGAVSLWDPNDPTAPAVSAGELPGPISDVTFGEGNEILMVGRNGAISWSTESQSVVWSTSESFQSVVLLADRHLYAFGGVDGTVYLVNTGSFDGLVSYKAHGSSISDLAVYPNGRYLAASGEGGAITLIDLDASYAVGGPGRDNPNSTINAIAYAPDGSSIVSAELDGQIILWDVDLDSWTAMACSIANRNLTAYEWTDYMGDLPYRDTCPALESGRDITEVVIPASPEAEDPFDDIRELGN